MQPQNLDEQIISILSSDPKLTEMWSNPPSAVHVPFMGDQGKVYLLVSIALSVDHVSFRDIAYACLTTAKLVLSHHLANNLPGLEVVPYIQEEQKVLRIMRLAIFANAYESALSLVDLDLLKDEPLPGIRCGWYVVKPMA